MHIYIKAIEKMFPNSRILLISPGPVSRAQLKRCAKSESQAAARSLETYAKALLKYEGHSNIRKVDMPRNHL